MATKTNTANAAHWLDTMAVANRRWVTVRDLMKFWHLTMAEATELMAAWRGGKWALA